MIVGRGLLHRILWVVPSTEESVLLQLNPSKQTEASQTLHTLPTPSEASSSTKPNLCPFELCRFPTNPKKGFLFLGSLGTAQSMSLAQASSAPRWSGNLGLALASDECPLGALTAQAIASRWGGRGASDEKKRVSGETRGIITDASPYYSKSCCEYHH